MTGVAVGRAVLSGTAASKPELLSASLVVLMLTGGAGLGGAVRPGPPRSSCYPSLRTIMVAPRREVSPSHSSHTIPR